MSQRSGTKRLWLRWLAAVVLLLCLLAAVAAALVFTEVGSGWLVAWCSPLLPSEVRFERFSGSLAGPFEFYGLEYTEAGLRVRVETLQVAWQPIQLLHGIIELDTVRVTGALASLRLDSTATDSAQHKTTAPEPKEAASSWQVRCGAVFVTGAVIEAPYGMALHDFEVTADGQLDAYRVKFGSAFVYDTLGGIRIDGAASGDLRGLKLDEVSIGRDSSRLVVTGELTWAPEVTWSLALNAEQIDPSAWAPNLDSLYGNVRGAGHTTGRLTDTSVEYTVVLDTVAGLLRGTSVSARGAMRDNDGRFMIDSSRIDWSGMSAHVQGVYGDTVQLNWDVSVPDLAVFNKQSAGQFQAGGLASGPADSLSITAGFKGRDLAFAEHKAGLLEGSLSWNAGGREISDLVLLARRVETRGVVVDSLLLSAHGTLGSHTGTLFLAGPQGNASLALEGSYDSVWQAVADSISIQSVRFGSWHLSSPASFSVGRGAYSLSEFCLENQEERLCLQGGFKTTREWDVKADLVKLPSAWLAPLLPESLSLATILDGSIELHARGEKGINGSAHLSTSPGWVLYGTSPEDTVRTEAFSIQFTGVPDSVHLSIEGGWGTGEHPTHLALDLGIPGTRRVISVLAGDTLRWLELPWSGSLSMQRITLQGFEHMLPVNIRLDGDASVQAHVSSHSGGRIEGECRVELPPGRLLLVPEEDTLVLNWSASSLLLRADSMGLIAQAAAALSTAEHSVGELSVDLNSSKPIDLQQSFNELPIVGSVRGQLDLAALQPFVTKVSGLQGHVDVNTKVSGTPGDLLLEGGLDLTAEAFVRDLGIQLSNIQFSMQGKGDSITVSGSMQSGEGTLALSGKLSRLPSREAPSRLHVQGENFLAFESREAKIWLSPDLDLMTTGDSLDVTGSVKVPKAQIEVVTLPKQAVAASKDVVVVGDTLAAARSTAPFWAQVQLILGDEVFFKGFDLSTFLDGTIETRVRPGSPIEGRGEVTLREGRYRGYGQDLQVDPGRFTFSGPIVDPAIDILAYRRANDNTKAGFKITGTISALKIDLYSDPYRSDNDAMSYVLFGRSTSENSESDRMRASEAAALVGGNLLAAQAASKIGLDEARIDPGTSENDAALVAGMYLSPQLFVGYGTGLFETLHTLRVRYIVSTHISLQAETGTRETADVLYQIERGK